MSGIKLTILPFLEAWDGSSLNVRLLLLPVGSPLAPLVTTTPAPTPNPSFAKSNFVFDVSIAPADILPSPGVTPFLTTRSPAAPNAEALYKACQAQLPIDASAPLTGKRPVGAMVKKYLPKSYQLASGYAPSGSANVFTDCGYPCMLKSPPANNPPKSLPVVSRIPWGKVIAILLRNPDLAAAAGLIRTFSMAISDKTILKDGGYVYVALNHTQSDAGSLMSSGGVKYYAAKLPPLQTGTTPQPRSFFTPVQFPVSTAGAPAGTDYSPIFTEVDNYSDGWAKTVHAYQPQQLSYLKEDNDGTRPAKELGIRLGWDDEQVTQWMHRQISDSPLIVGLDVALGVAGYRIDAAVHGSGSWTSLCQAAGPISINAPGLPSLPDFKGELKVETNPIQNDGTLTGDFWLPQYFSSWYGPSLATSDRNAIVLGGQPTDINTGRIQGVDPAIWPTYGLSYDFRVRLVDSSFGGPAPTTANVPPAVPGPNPVATIAFKRWIRPLAPIWANRPPFSPPSPPVDPSTLNTLSFNRPLIQYPAVKCTGYYPNAISMLHTDIPLAVVQSREPGLADPDVDRLQITVMVQGLKQDTATDKNGYSIVYVAKRAFPSNPSDTLSFPVQYVDVEDVSTMVDHSGPLLLPTARNVRLSCVALCREDPSLTYFGADDVRTGPATLVNVRRQSTNETDLYVGELPATQLGAVFCQPDPPQNAKPAKFSLITLGSVANTSQLISFPDIGSRLATTFNLRNNGLTLRAPPGRRVVISAATSLRHVLGPDLASITFTSQSDIARHWVVCIKLTLKRDWSWDALQYNGVVVSRDGIEVGRFSPTRNVSVDALQPGPGSSIDRSQTDLIFFDSIDPKPPTGNFPTILTPVWTVAPAFLGSPTVELSHKLTLTLPITTTPAQVPSIVSAGIALSPFTPSSDYSSTATRQKRLWIEFASPPSDPQDQFFCRVLRTVPDPLLSTTSISLSDTPEPALPIDPEPVRYIVPDESDDRAGLSTMQLLTPSSTSAVHYSLPLPPGLSATSPELFGFFTYEFRLGHYGIAPDLGASWSTAQGRYGRPLRVAGIQHPLPPLMPTVQRNADGITVSAPFACPVLDGVVVQPQPLRSSMWILLYAQVAQLDNRSASVSASSSSLPQQQFRNVLLTRLPASYVRTRLRKQYAFAEASIAAGNVDELLVALGLRTEAPLSVLAVEMQGQNFYAVGDPLGADLGRARVLRTSELVAVGKTC